MAATLSVPDRSAPEAGEMVSLWQTVHRSLYPIALAYFSLSNPAMIPASFSSFASS